jgi:enterochelin esterase family protein
VIQHIEVRAMKLNVPLAFPLFASAVFAQAPQSDNVVSPEVQTDRRVTFRVRAPQASDVSFYGEWMPTGSREKMTKDAQGVWSLTLGPLAPGIYLYTFTVDGLTIADPVNPRVKLRSRTSASLVEVPGPAPEIWEPRNVPHGAVEINWQQSKVINGETGEIWVYTPPGYEKSRSRYPVLYLFHGSNDIAGGWTLAGRANLILDNLLAEKKLTPMIVVMPYGHAVPFGAPREAQANNTALFEDYVLKDVMPLIESRYRVAPGRRNRAIAGLSMGGGQALHIGFGHLDLFNAVGAFSAAVPGDFETRFQPALAEAKTTNERLNLLWLGCGRQDSLFGRSEKLSELLNARGIRHTFRATEGAHNYTIWRQYLSEFAPLLFR